MKTRTHWTVVFVVTLGAGLVLANSFNTVANFFGGLNVAPRSLATTTNKVTRMLSSGSTYLDFAQLADGGCETKAVAVSGAQSGDPCFVGVGSVLGVSSINLMQQDTQSVYSCFVGVDGGSFVRRCQTVEQGAYDPDGGYYTLRIISSQ